VRAEPRRTRRQLYLVSLNHFVNDGSVYLLSSLFPVVVVLFGLTGLQLGVIVGVGYLVSVVFQLLVGRYSEGRRPRDMLVAGIAVVSVGVTSFVFASGFYSLLISVVALRVGSSFYHPVGVSAVSSIYEGPELDNAMGFQSAFGNLGILAVFLASAPIYVAFGWKAAFATFGALGALDIALTLSFFGSVKKVQTGAAAAREGGATQHSGVPAFFLWTMFLSGGAYAVVLNFSNLFLQQGGMGVVGADAMVAAWVASAFIGAILVGRLTARVERGLLLAAAYGVSAVTALLIVIAHQNIAVETAVLAVNGFALSATYPITYSALSDHIARRPEIGGRSFGVIFSAQTVGGAVLGLLAGYISDAFGLSVAFLLVAVLLLFGGALSLSWARRRRTLGSPGQRAEPV
jgi:MFS transporter, FSR family, fosmidomycin resistance protein